MNWKSILSIGIAIVGLINIATGAVIPVLNGATADLFALAYGIIILLFGVIGYLKRDRWDYWLTMLQGKPHIETLITHDPRTYDEMNKEPNLKRGQLLERVAFALVYGIALAGYVAIPFVGPVMMGLIAGITIASAAGLYALKFVLAHYEFKSVATKRQVIIEWVDEENNEGEAFLKNVKMSRRAYVDKTSMIRVIDAVEKQIKASQTEKTIAGDYAVKRLNPEVAAQIEKYRTATDNQLEEKIINRLKASDALQKFYAVGIDQTVDFDYAEDHVVKEAIIAEDKKLGTEATPDITPTVTILTDPKTKKKPRPKYYCTTCGNNLEPSQSPKFFFKCSDCGPTNEATFEKMVIYEPHIYTFYPEGDLKRRCIVVFPVKVNIALDPDSEIMIRFHYTRFKAKANWIRAIKIGTVMETLFDGDFIDGLKIELPKNIQALDTVVPIFVATDFDYAEKRRLEGLQMVRPPALLKWVIRLIKAIITASSVGHKLEDKEVEIGKLSASRSRLMAIINKARAEAELERDDPQILPPVQTAEEPRPQPKAKPLAKMQALGIAITLFFVGVIVGVYAVAPFLG